MAEKSILFDTTKCMACRGCQVACKQWNELPGETTTNRGSYENPADLSPQTWLKINFIEVERQGQVNWLFKRQACMHCTDAACVRVCPTKALYHHDSGMVSYDKELCSGCGYCLDFCPFHTPRLQQNLLTGVAKMDKCVMCTNPGLDRIGAGYQPACVKTCPPGALTYGDRDARLAEGRKSVAALQANGYKNAYLYGEKELGGLHVMYVLDDSPGVYGLPVDPKVPAAALTKSVVQPIGWGLGALTLVGLALNFMVSREAKIAHELPSASKEKK
ncbi:MAG: 4Fe-4S dicluster domain-containing protein [Dehalococcoidales bacterium]|nr:4Fe-4S dicluster domain-containing protein [Dehalococcoidales bacterium]